MDAAADLRWLIGACLSLTVLLGASRGLAQEAAGSDAPDERQRRIETLRADATAKLARGQWTEARASFDRLLELSPHDAAAKREAGRAAMAAGELDYAARVLEEAHHGGGHHHDPELHYLRGEALYALGRTDEARNEHRITELELGLAPRDRMSTLWLARVYARRGETERADLLYEGLTPPAGQPPDAEVAINHADAHLLMKDWAGAERLLRRFLARSSDEGRSPDELRARGMLAWTLEAQGKLADELRVRARLADDDPSPATQADYGRALERDGDYRAALGRYARAERAGGADATLEKARERMRYRLTPEVAGGFAVRSDPTTVQGHVQAGAALPFASRDLVSVIVAHDVARGGFPDAQTSVSTLNAQLLFMAPWNGSLMLGGQARGVSELPVGSDGTRLQVDQGLRFGGVGELRTALGPPVRLEARGELENQWTEAPVSIRENGVVTGVTGHLFVFPVPRTERVIIDVGTQARRLLLPPGSPGAVRPEASQLLAWGGADFVLWQNPVRNLRGQILDESLVRPTDVAESVTFTLRHYELRGRNDPEFERRVALLPSARIDVGSLVARGALLDGRGGFELRGGLGFDSARRDVLTQAGASLYAAAGAAGRVSVSYDFSQELIIGLLGRRHTGWVSYHVDL